MAGKVAKINMLISVPIGATVLMTLGARQLARRMVAPSYYDPRTMTPWELGIPFEDVVIQSSDGIRLKGWWITHPEAKRTVITLAGHRRRKSDCLGIAGALWRHRMNILMFDYRGRGDSDPYINTLGYYETQDTLAAINFASRKAHQLPVALIGYSMGASIAIMAAARDQRVSAVIADSPFASQKKVIRRYFRSKTGLPAFPIVNLAEKFLPYNIDEVEPIREVRKISPRAIMLIHGECDDLCSPEDSIALYEAAGDPKELWVLPNVGHCGAYFQDREAYVNRVVDFLETHAS